MTELYKDRFDCHPIMQFDSDNHGTIDVTEEFNWRYEVYKDGLESMSLVEYQEYVKNKESDNEM